MSTTTTNFGWTIPSDTDLVKDGAAAMRTLGQAIDTSMADLEGGTTGQILSKTSGTDMDFTWIDPTTGDITGVTAGTGISGGGTSGTVTVTNSMATAIDAKGDLIGGTGADTFARLPVGTNGQVLSADSAETTGLKWIAASSGKIKQVVSVSTSTVTSVSSTTYTDATNLTATITPTSASNKVLVLVSLNSWVYVSSNNNCYGYAQIVRGATSIFACGCVGGGGTSLSAIDNLVQANLTYLDSPATTSATTYKIQIKRGDSGTHIANNYGSSSITLIEVE